VPNAASPAATTRLTSASRAASPVMAIARPPSLTISAAVSSTSAPERAVHTTAAPSRAKSRLITRPMPLLAPVISATLPSSRPIDDSCRRGTGSGSPVPDLERPSVHQDDRGPAAWVGGTPTVPAVHSPWCPGARPSMLERSKRPSPKAILMPRMATT